jgi:hypothetical protein
VSRTSRVYTGVGLVVFVGGDRLVVDEAVEDDAWAEFPASPPSPFFTSCPSSPSSSSMRMTSSSSSSSSREEVGGGVCGMVRWGVEGGVKDQLWLGEYCLGEV